MKWCIPIKQLLQLVKSWSAFVSSQSCYEENIVLLLALTRPMVIILSLVSSSLCFFLPTCPPHTIYQPFKNANYRVQLALAQLETRLQRTLDSSKLCSLKQDETNPERAPDKWLQGPTMREGNLLGGEAVSKPTTAPIFVSWPAACSCLL